MTQLSLFESVEIALTRGYRAIVDPVDLDLMMCNWQALVKPSGNAYAQRNVAFNKNLLMHREIMSRMLGRTLDDREFIDHINGNGLDNRRANLRLATPAQNAANRKANKNNTSGYKGVFWTGGHFFAAIRVNGDQIRFGPFSTAIDAGIAYNHAAAKYQGEFACFNEIPGWRDIQPPRITSWLPEDDIAAIKREIDAGVKSLGQIARDHNVSTSYVSLIRSGKRKSKVIDMQPVAERSSK